jgi:K+-dependent Na+/Ca+ exchanger-like protein
MMLIAYFLILLVSFYFIAKICDDYFVESLDKFAHRLNLSSDAAGATLMAIGSSAPELMVAIISVIKPGNHEMIGMGNIVGSAIFNVLVITGAVGLIRQFHLKWHVVTRDLFFYLISVLFLFYVFFDGSISLFEAITFIIIYVLYVFTVVKWKKVIDFSSEIKEVDDAGEGLNIRWLNGLIKPFDFVLEKIFFTKGNYIYEFFVSIALIALFSWVLVESAIGVSAILEIPEAFVAITVLAVGTSVPDLMSSIIVGRQNRGGMAVSNAIGSNIFDILVGLGVPFILMIVLNGGKVPIDPKGLIPSTILLICSVVLILLLLIINKWNIGKKMGWTLLLLYLAYIVWQFVELYV